MRVLVHNMLNPPCLVALVMRNSSSKFCSNQSEVGERLVVTISDLLYLFIKAHKVIWCISIYSSLRIV